MGSFARFMADFCAIAIVTRKANGALLGHPRIPQIEGHNTDDPPLFAP
jgi:hypothetical protein